MSVETDPDFESTQTRARKRMLPSVAEVARELSRRTTADAATILTISRKVCGEELGRIKEGQESAPVEVLVGRALILLEPAAVVAPLLEPEPLPERLVSAEPVLTFADGADPFSETMGSDLRWDRESDNGGGPSGGAISTIEPPPLSDSAGLFNGSFPAGADSLSPITYGSDEAGGSASTGYDEGPSSPEGGASSDEYGVGPVSKKRSRLPLILGAGLALAAIGGGGWYFFMGQPSRPSGPPPPLPSRKPRPPAAAPASAAPATTVPATAPVTAAPAAPVATPPALQPTVAPTPAAPPPTPAPVKPTAVVSRPVAREATPSAPPEPVRVQSAPKAAVSSETASKPEASPQSQARAGTLVTPDWTGTPVHVVHFSSFTDKARAERHAASLAKELGLPARAVQVDLGARGIWYRTVVGEFASAAEALTFRKDLLDRKTQGVGLVYRMTSKP